MARARLPREGHRCDIRFRSTPLVQGARMLWTSMRRRVRLPDPRPIPEGVREPIYIRKK